MTKPGLKPGRRSNSNRCAIYCHHFYHHHHDYYYGGGLYDGLKWGRCMPRMYLTNITITVSVHGHCTCVCMCVFMFGNNGGGFLLSSAARIWEPNPTVPVSGTISARCLDMGPSSDSENGPKCYLCLMMTSLSQALTSSYSKRDCRPSNSIPW